MLLPDCEQILRWRDGALGCAWLVLRPLADELVQARRGVGVRRRGHGHLGWNGQSVSIHVREDRVKRGVGTIRFLRPKFGQLQALSQAG